MKPNGNVYNKRLVANGTHSATRISNALIHTRSNASRSRPTVSHSQLVASPPLTRRGDDAFDKSFIIENSNGDFLGECGVSISEYVNTDDGARNVTAFEIWLFDKNDTHTVTKVLMSDYAFSDEATRAKAGRAR